MPLARQDRDDHLAQLGRSLAELMHDLRGPLTTIAGFAELMSLEDDAEKRRGWFEAITSQVERVNRMSRDTLAFARGERPLLRRRVNLNMAGQELEQALARIFCGTGITPRLDLEYRGTAELDWQQVLRACENLAHNAVAAMARGGGSRFTLTVEREGAELVVTCSDDGPGFPAELQGRMFEPFATSGEVEGTGLGLHIVRRIARDHGGDARIKQGGAGACIELRLPAAV